MRDDHVDGVVTPSQSRSVQGRPFVGESNVAVRVVPTIELGRPYIGSKMQPGLRVSVGQIRSAHHEYPIGNLAEPGPELSGG